MSNWIGVRRAKFQEIDKHGKPMGDPTFGVIAAYDYCGDYSDLWHSMDDLNEAITDAGGMLGLLEVDFGVDTEDPVFLDNYDGPKPTHDSNVEENNL
jgi:hypothetical protein